MNVVAKVSHHSLIFLRVLNDTVTAVSVGRIRPQAVGRSLCWSSDCSPRFRNSASDIGENHEYPTRDLKLYVVENLGCVFCLLTSCGLERERKHFEDIALAYNDKGHLLAQFCRKNRIYTVPRQVLVFYFDILQVIHIEAIHVI
jgi:hypothetical protein